MTRADHWPAHAGKAGAWLAEGMKREVGASPQVSVTAPTVVELQVAVASQPGLRVEESLSVMLDGAAVSVREIASVVITAVSEPLPRDSVHDLVTLG